MGNGNEKAKLTVLVSDITNTNGTYSATYTGQTNPPPTQGNGSAMPSVTVDSTNGTSINLFTDTNVTFKLEDEGWTFPTASGATLIEIKVGNATTFTSFTADSSEGSFKVNAPTDGGKELELEDEDNDGSANVRHQFCLQAVNGGATHSLDPNFWNRR